MSLANILFETPRFNSLFDDHFLFGPLYKPRYVRSYYNDTESDVPHENDYNKQPTPQFVYDNDKNRYVLTYTLNIPKEITQIIYQLIYQNRVHVIQLQLILKQKILMTLVHNIKLVIHVHYHQIVILIQ